MIGLFCVFTLLASTSAESEPWSEHPYLVTVNDEDGTFMCTGALINSRTVLTAASCLFQPEFSNSTGYVIDTLDALVRGLHVREVLLHENQDDNNPNDYDIAILYTYQPVNLFFSLDRSIAAGAISKHPQLVALGLRKGTVSKTNLVKKKCTIKNLNEKRMFCAESIDGDGICNFGEPVVDLKQNKIVGIFGYKKDAKCNPGDVLSYTKIEFYLEWIESTLDDVAWWNWLYYKRIVEESFLER